MVAGSPTRELLLSRRLRARYLTCDGNLIEPFVITFSMHIPAVEEVNPAVESVNPAVESETEMVRAADSETAILGAAESSAVGETDSESATEMLRERHRVRAR